MTLILLTLLSLSPMVPQGNIPCSQLQLPEGSIPSGTFAARYIDTLSAPIDLATPSDPIVAVKIGQPINDADVVCGVSYEASLTNGVATLTFHHGAPYYVELHHTSGATTAGVFMVQSIVGPDEGKPAKAPARNERKTDLDDDVWIHSEDNIAGQVCHGGNVADKHGAGTGTIGEIQQIVCDAYAANGNQKIKLVLAAHGRSNAGAPVEGKVGLGGSNNPVMDKNNARAYGAAIKDKVDCINVMSCYAGLGQDGAAMLTELGEGACTDTCGWSDCITYSRGKRWGGFFTGWVDHFKIYVNGDKFTYDFVEGGGEVELQQLVAASTRLPIQYAMPGPPALEQIVGDWGQQGSVWDLDNDNTVNVSDIILFLNCIGY